MVPENESVNGAGGTDLTAGASHVYLAYFEGEQAMIERIAKKSGDATTVLTTRKTDYGIVIATSGADAYASIESDTIVRLPEP